MTGLSPSSLEQRAAVTWAGLVSHLERIERDEASHQLRIVSVATCATELPAEGEHGFRLHAGTFAGWVVQPAEFEDADLVAVVRLSNGDQFGVTAGGDVVEVANV